MNRVPHRWGSLAILATGLSMIVLDGTVLGVALPTIITDLGLDLADAQWLNASYAVVFAALLMGFGRLGDRIGRRGVFLLGVVIFVAGSVWAALSASAEMLVAARVLQGVGGAMVLPSSLSTVNATFRGRDRAAAFGIWGAVMAGMAAIGPLLGGWLTTRFAWQWIFWINVPIGAVVLGAAVLVVLDTRGESDAGGFDWLGLVLSVVGFGSLVFAIIEGPALGWVRPVGDAEFFGLVWPSSRPIALPAVALLLGAACIASFLWWQRHQSSRGRPAILNLELLSIPTFSWGNLTAMLVAAGEFTLVFVIPLYLVGVLGLTTLGAGWVLAAMAFGAFLSGALARHLSARLGAPRVVILGLLLEVLGVAATALLLGPKTAPAVLAGTLAVYGVGLGLASAQLTSTVLGDIPPERSGQGSATQSTVRQVGSALGTALSGAVLAAGLNRVLAADLQALGLPAARVDQLVEATKESAGGNLAGLREASAAGELGPTGQAIVDAVAQGFTGAASWAIWAAAACLLVGLAGAIRVAVAHRATRGAVSLHRIAS